MGGLKLQRTPNRSSDSSDVPLSKSTGKKKSAVKGFTFRFRRLDEITVDSFDSYGHEEYVPPKSDALMENGTKTTSQFYSQRQQENTPPRNKTPSKNKILKAFLPSNKKQRLDDVMKFQRLNTMESEDTQERKCLSSLGLPKINENDKNELMPMEESRQKSTLNHNSTPESRRIPKPKVSKSTPRRGLKGETERKIIMNRIDVPFPDIKKHYSNEFPLSRSFLDDEDKDDDCDDLPASSSKLCPSKIIPSIPGNIFQSVGFMKLDSERKHFTGLDAFGSKDDQPLRSCPSEDSFDIRSTKDTIDPFAASNPIITRSLLGTDSYSGIYSSKSGISSSEKSLYPSDEGELEFRQFVFDKNFNRIEKVDIAKSDHGQNNFSDLLNAATSITRNLANRSAVLDNSEQSRSSRLSPPKPQTISQPIFRNASTARKDVAISHDQSGSQATHKSEEGHMFPPSSKQKESKNSKAKSLRHPDKKIDTNMMNHNLKYANASTKNWAQVVVDKPTNANAASHAIEKKPSLKDMIFCEEDECDENIDPFMEFVNEEYVEPFQRISYNNNRAGMDHFATESADPFSDNTWKLPDFDPFGFPKVSSKPACAINDTLITSIQKAKTTVSEGKPDPSPRAETDHVDSKVLNNTMKHFAVALNDPVFIDQPIQEGNGTTGSTYSKSIGSKEDINFLSMKSSKQAPPTLQQSRRANMRAYVKDNMDQLIGKHHSHSGDNDDMMVDVEDDQSQRCEKSVASKKSIGPQKMAPKAVPTNAILGSMLFRQTLTTQDAASPIKQQLSANRLKNRVASYTDPKQKPAYSKTEELHDLDDDEEEDEDDFDESNHNYRTLKVPHSVHADGAESCMSSVTEEASSFYQKNFQPTWTKQAQTILNCYNVNKAKNLNQRVFEVTQKLNRLEEEHTHMFTSEF